MQPARFPFPTLGLDTDNGGEFINEEVAAYCASEQITFTRGRPYEKRDQCFVEQKNGVVVRQVVGHGRLMGEHACRQLGELYQALHFYVNCFQPSMKLVATYAEDRTTRRVYDAARTPLQRLLLSGILPAPQQQEWEALVHALDPLRLFEAVDQLQQAVLRCVISRSAACPPPPATALLTFRIEACARQPVPSIGKAGLSSAAVPSQHQEPAESVQVLSWRRTSTDPFAGQWERIFALVQANPTRSSADILRELQSLFPGRYQPSHLRTLQRGMHRIRVQLLDRQQASGLHEVIQEGQGRASSPAHAAPPSASTSLAETSAPSSPSLPSHASAEEPPMRTRVQERRTSPPVSSAGEGDQRPAAPATQAPQATPAPRTALAARSALGDHSLTMSQAIDSYLQAHRTAGHRPKTLEWHRTALHHLHRYLLAEHQLLHVSQLTGTILRDWVAFLQQTPPSGSAPLAASTIETYARSVRAFCTWLVQQGVLPVFPMSREAFPRASTPLPVCVSPATFEQFMQASFPPEAKGSHVRHQAARDRALLWVLFETGITVSELCALRVGDLNQDAGLLAVRGEQGKERQLALGPSCLDHLLAFVEQAHAMSTTSYEPLFRAESGLPLTKNSLTLLFRRLHARVGVSKTPITPQSLRHSFALRYLQAGGSPHGLRELLGYEGMTQVKQYLRWHEQLVGAHAREQSRPDLVER